MMRRSLEVEKFLESMSKARISDYTSDADATALHKAVIAGDAVEAAVMCRNGVDFQARMSMKQHTPLHAACASGHLSMVQLLLAAKAAVCLELQDEDSCTPLQLLMNAQ